VIPAGLPQMRQGTGHAVRPPAAMLWRRTYHQGLQRRVCPWSTGVRALPRTTQGRAIRVRCHASIVSGVTSVATAPRVCFPSVLPRTASVIRSPSRRRLVRVAPLARSERSAPCRDRALPRDHQRQQGLSTPPGQGWRRRHGPPSQSDHVRLAHRSCRLGRSEGSRQLQMLRCAQHNNLIAHRATCIHVI